ncbi:MAG: hypothetical protein AAF221_08400 [Pseudomonadota bacterium]
MALPLIPIAVGTLLVGAGVGTGVGISKAGEEVGEGVGDGLRILAIVAGGYVLLRYGPRLFR